MDVPQNNCSKILQNSEHSINSGSFLINIEKFAQSWDSDIEVETKKTWISKQPRHINGWTGYSAFYCIGILPKSILVFVDFVIVIRMNASLYLLNAPA